MAFVSLLEFDDITSQRVLFNFEHHGRTLRIFEHSQVVTVLGLSHDHHVGDSELASCTDEVFQRILLRFFKFSGRIRVHQISHVLEEFSQVNSNLASLDNECYNRKLISLAELQVKL